MGLEFSLSKFGLGVKEVILICLVLMLELRTVDEKQVWKAGRKIAMRKATSLVSAGVLAVLLFRFQKSVVLEPALGEPSGLAVCCDLGEASCFGPAKRTRQARSLVQGFFPQNAASTT